MSTEPLVSQQIPTANSFLWAVKTYLDLISGEGRLVAGSGLKKLYALSSGVATANLNDATAIAAKAERIGLSPNNLHGFMVGCIVKNLFLYGQRLQSIIHDRVVSIANGDVVNPKPLVKFSPEEARRFFYTPPAYFVTRVKQALAEDSGPVYSFSPPRAVTLDDVATESDLILMRMTGSEGHLTPTETSWGALIAATDGLVEVLQREAQYDVADREYKGRARAALKILWMFTKLVLGDLTVRPARESINLVDLDHQINLSDGTLASIPFPLQETVIVFADDETQGVSMKGRFYLSAVSAAALYRPVPGDS